MLKRLLALLLAAGVPVLAGSARSQTIPAQVPIVCHVKDNVEDSACQQRLKGLFARDGDKLTLKLGGGKSKSYTGNGAACDGENVDAGKCLVYNVLAYYPQIQFYVIEQGYYECGSYLLVSRRSGSETAMKEIPILSPNAKYLVLTDQSDACDRDFEIGVWSVQDPPKLEFKYNARGYENWEIKAWKDDRHLDMKAFVNGPTSYVQEAELVRGESGRWSLVLGKKTDHK
jgi:hypothetical protein